MNAYLLRYIIVHLCFKITKKPIFYQALILFGIFVSINSSAIDLKGYVRNPENDALTNAHVLLLNTPFGATTDSLGFFRISNLSEGNYTLYISYLGYETLVKEIDVKDTLGTYDFVLSPITIQLNQGIIVSGSRFQSSKFLSPFSVTSINTAELKATYPRTTPESLISNGVWVQKTNHGGGSPFVRGLTGYHTLLMIDGIRLNNATFRSGPNQYLNTLDPLTISNIEIIRSSGSVQYGSDAIGGTVHFFTKTPQFSTNNKVLFEPHLIVKYVSQGVNKINKSFPKVLFPGMERIVRSEATVAGKSIAFYGGFGFKKFNDMEASASLGTLKPTGYDEYDADAKILIKKDKHKFTAAFQMVKQNNVPLYHKVVTGTYSIYNFDPQFRSLVYLKHEFLVGDRWARKISTTLYRQHSVEERHKQISGETKQNIDLDKVRSTGATIDLFSSPTKYWTFNSGIDINYDKVNSSTRITNQENAEIENFRGLYPDNSTAWNIALFSLHQININRFVINSGIRFNNFHITSLDTIFGNTRLMPSALVGNIGLSYMISKQVRIVSMLNTGFRAPNINDVSSFGISDFRYEIPGSNLKPEKSISYEVGYRQKSSKISSSFSLFTTILTNLITNVPTSYLGQDSILIDIDNMEYIHYYRKENTNKAHIWGFEAETEIQLLGWLNSYGRLYYTFGQDISKNEPLRRIPPVNGVIGLNIFPGESTHIRTEYLFAGKQDRLSSGDISDNRISDGGTPGWTIINISMGYTGLNWIDINIGVSNLFDTAYRIHGSGVDGYGRNIWLGIKLNFFEFKE